MYTVVVFCFRSFQRLIRQKLGNSSLITCDSLRLRSAASLFRSVLLMYFCLRKVLSSSFRCSSEKTALLRIPLRVLGLISVDHIRIFASSKTKKQKHILMSVCWPKLLYCQHQWDMGHWLVVVIGGLWNGENKLSLHVKRGTSNSQKIQMCVANWDIIARYWLRWLWIIFSNVLWYRQLWLKGLNLILSARNMHILPTKQHFLSFQFKIKPVFVTLTLSLTFDFSFSIRPI